MGPAEEAVFFAEEEALLLVEQQLGHVGLSGLDQGRVAFRNPQLEDQASMYLSPSEVVLVRP